MNKILRPCGKITDNIIIASFFSLLLAVFGALITQIAFKLTHFVERMEGVMHSDNLAVFLTDYAMFLGIWVLCLLVVIIFKANRPMLKALGWNRSGNNLKGILAGILLGFGTNGFCVLMSLLMGDIKLSYNGIDPKILLLFLIAVFIQSGGEEITDRFYLYQKLRRRYRSPLVAILVNSIVFMAMHIMNPGFTVIAGSQILLIGIIFSLLVYYYNSLWAAMWFHAAWNYTQNIIFGLPNSGVVSEYSIFKLEAASATNGLFYDVKFGVEGSIGSSIVLLIILIAILIINRKKPESRDCWKESEKVAAAILAQAPPKHAAS